MAPWKAIGSVLAGTVVTVVLTLVTAVLLPILGIATAMAVGNGLPSWLFAFPLALCAVVGGAIAGVLQGVDTARGAVVGCIAAASGVTVLGMVVGLVLSVVALGFTPGHAGEVSVSEVALSYTALGGGAGFVVGGVLGALGGAGGYVGRREFERS